MTSVQIRLHKTDSGFLEKATSKVTDEGGKEWYLIPMFFSKVDNGLFVEYLQSDLPEKVKQQFNKTEKAY